MAQALCSRTFVPASLGTALPVRAARGNVAVRLSSKKVAVSASMKDAEEFLKKEENQSAVATTMAASVFSMLASAPSAAAAQMVGELAADNRPLVLLLPLVAAVGWVLFNITGPAFRQLQKMLGESPLTGVTKKGPTKKRAVIGAAGLGAMAALYPESADAAQEIAALAADNRPLVLLLPVVAAAGWVLFNIAGPALRQLEKMTGGSLLPSLGAKKAPAKKSGTVKRAVIGAAGLGALAAMSPESADAAQEIAALAADNRPLVLLLPVAAAAGWVLFNIAGPGLRQLEKMAGGSLLPAGGPKKATLRKRAVVGAAGLGAMAALYPETANAAQEIATVAEDLRPLVLLLPVAAAAGWVLFNIAGPGLRQLEKMSGGPLLPSLGSKGATKKVTKKR